MRIKKGDTIYVLTGDSRGKTGRVLHVNTKKGMVLVEGVNMKRRHQRPTQKSPKGGIISLEAPIRLSNVALYSPSISGPTRVSYRIIEEGGRKKRVRVCRKTGEQL